MKKKRDIRLYLAALVGLATFLVYLLALRNRFVYWDDNLYIFENPYIQSLDSAFFRWAFLDFHVSNWHPLTWVSHALDYAIWGLNPMGHHLTSIILHAVNTVLVVLLVVRLLEASRRSISDKISPNPSLSKRGAIEPASLPEKEPVEPPPLPERGITEPISLAGCEPISRTSLPKRETTTPPPLAKGDRGGFSDKQILIAAGVSGLLFGIHPLHVESVAWVSERKDLLCAFFFLLSIMAYVRYATKTEKTLSMSVIPAEAGIQSSQGTLDAMVKPEYDRNKRVIPQPPIGAGGRLDRGIQFLNRYYLSSLIFFILALMSKPMAVSLPVVLLILDWYPLGRIVPLRTLWKASVEKIPFIALSGISSIITIFAQKAGGSITTTDVVPLTIRMLVAVKSLGWYLGKTLLPLDLIPLHPYPKRVSLLSAEYMMPALLIVVITAVCVISLKKYKALTAVWGYYIATIIPVLGIVQVGSQAMADRYMYLPSFGPFLAIGAAAAWTAAKTTKAWGHGGSGLFFSLLALLVIAISFSTGRQIRIWHDSVTLWSHEIDNETDAQLAYVNRGIAFKDAGQFQKAIADLDKAIALNPSDFRAYYNRGVVFTELNLPFRAIKDFDAAIAVNPALYKAYINRGALYFKQGLLDLALADFTAAISLDPLNHQAYANRGLAYYRAGRIAEALADLDKAISLNPNSPDAYYNRGLIFSRTPQLDRALADFDKALSLNPSDPDAYYNRGMVLSKMGRTDEANRDFIIWEKYSPKK